MGFVKKALVWIHRWNGARLDLRILRSLISLGLLSRYSNSLGFSRGGGSNSICLILRSLISLGLSFRNGGGSSSICLLEQLKDGDTIIIFTPNAVMRYLLLIVRSALYLKSTSTISSLPQEAAVCSAV